MSNQPETAVAMSRAIEDRYSKRHKQDRQRKQRNLSQLCDTPSKILSRMKGECRRSIDALRVNNIEGLKNAIPSDRWCTAPCLTASYIASIEECLILAYSWKSEVTRHHVRLKEVLLDTAHIAISNCKSPKNLRDYLLFILVDLVFMFVGDHADDSMYGPFVRLLGLSGKKTYFTKTAIKTQNVVFTLEILTFHIDLIHSYCQKFNHSELKSMLKSVLACLGVMASEDIIAHFSSLLW